MKKLLLSFICIYGFLISNAVTSQEMNEKFLKSLPKSVQEEFLNLADTDESLSENFNDRPETRIRKIEQRIDEYKDQLESLETQLTRDDTKEKDDLIIFGSNFFDSYQSTFAPINQLNFTSDYILDVGDVLNIQSLGTASMGGSKDKIVVARDGSVNIPKVGQINVAGMAYDEAIKSIKEFAQSKYLNMDLYINLEQARDMSILLIGNAIKPGIYTLPGGSNILSLLHAAGGVSDDGSYRSIIHKRNNKIIQEIDLYDILIKGNLLFKSPLRSGDSIIINPSKRHVAISGGINTPAIYELKDNETLADLVNLAQGLSVSASDEILIFNSVGGAQQVSPEEMNLTELSHGDSVKIPLFSPITSKILTVTIEGAVKKPGEYSFNEGATLHEMIAEAGGYTDNAYPYGGSLFRKRVADIQRETFEKTYANLINYLASNSNVGSVANSSNLDVILAELKASKFEGRLSAEFSERKVKEDPSLDTFLADGDRVVIPLFTSDVFVTGDVLNPGARRYNSELKTKDYIALSGGLGRFADKDRILVIKPDGDAEVVKAKLFFSSADLTLYPGSIIYVPREIGKLEGIAYTATLAPIISSMALSLASLNSIN